MSDVVFPRSDLRRGRIGLAVGNEGGACWDMAAGRGGTEMSVDCMARSHKEEQNGVLEYRVGVTVRVLRDKRGWKHRQGIQMIRTRVATTTHQVFLNLTGSKRGRENFSGNAEAAITITNIL